MTKAILTLTLLTSLAIAARADSQTDAAVEQIKGIYLQHPGEQLSWMDALTVFGLISAEAHRKALQNGDTDKEEMLRFAQYLADLQAKGVLPAPATVGQQSPTPTPPAAEAADDTLFFAGAHLGMTLTQCEAFYHGFDIYAVGHSGSPQGEAQVDFRTSAVPQRRVYVFYRKSNGKIVSVMYWKLGENETFSKDEIQFLTSLNQGRGSLVTQVSESGSEFEVSTPRQFQLEQAQADPMIKNHD